MKRTPKRTKKLYTDLFDAPCRLVSGTGEGHGPGEVILFPNGEREVWFKGPVGHGFKLQFSVGPFGMSSRVTPFTGTPGLTVMGNTRSEAKPVHLEEPIGHLEVCQYFAGNPRADAFREWYLHGGPYPEEKA